MMKFKIFFILTIIFLFPLLLRSDNDFANVKLNIKLDEDNIIKMKSMGEDEILSGAFYGKILSSEDKNFANANLECDFIGRSYKGRGFSCGFAVIEDLKGFCYIKNNNSEDILMVEWNCNTTAGINGFGEINMPIAKTINSDISSPLNINLNIKYPMSLNK